MPALPTAASTTAVVAVRRTRTRILDPFPSLSPRRASSSAPQFAAGEQVVTNAIGGSGGIAICVPPINTCIHTSSAVQPNGASTSLLRTACRPFARLGTVVCHNRTIIAASFSSNAASAADCESNHDHDHQNALLQQLEVDTDAALRGEECKLMTLLDGWSRLHESLQPLQTRAEWSDISNPKLRQMIRCAERIDELVRSYNHEGGGVYLSSAFAGGTDELEPYRLAIGVWGKTPTPHSGDRAAAILEMWGNKYGGDMTQQPTIDAFDAVLEAYGISANMHAVGTASDDFEEEPIEHPDDKALSTLRLLRNLGDMYLVPTVSTVSCVIRALRRASRTSRGCNDGRNEERTRTVLALLREIEQEAASLFENNHDDLTDEEKKHQYSYIRGCCDAFAMSVKNLPIDEAIKEGRYFFDEIDRHAFGHGSELIPSLASETGNLAPDMPRIIPPLQNTCTFALDSYRDRATNDDTLADPKRRRASDDCRHISSIAREAIDLVNRMKRWDGVVNSRQYVTLERICCLSTHPNIIHDDFVDVAGDVVPLLLHCEELLLGAKDMNVRRKGFNALMSSWAALSGVVKEVWDQDGSVSNPADHAENLLRIKMEMNLLCKPEQRLDLTLNYHSVLLAWSRAQAGRFGAKKALDLFDDMRSNRICATPDEVTYGLVLRCLRYAKNPSMASKAESIITEMHKGFESGANDSVRPTARHYGAAIAAIAKSGHRDSASMSKSLLKQLLISYHENKDDALLPDNYMFCEVMNAIGWDRGNSLNKALKIKNLMRNLVDMHEETGHERLVPNEAVYGTAISAIASSPDDGEALEIMESLLDQMRSYNIRPNERLMAVLIDCYGKFRLPEAAESALRQMEAVYMDSGKKQFQPTTKSYNAAILAFAKVGNAERCRALLDEMLDKYSRGDAALKPDHKTFVSIINALWKSGGANVPEEATDILQLMEDKYFKGDLDLAPTASAYTSVVNAIARSDLPDKAVRAKELLQRAKHQLASGNALAKPDASLYTAVLNACAFTKGSHDDRATALTIAKEVEAELHDNPSLRWDSIAFNTILQVYGYLITNETERAKLSSGIFKRCCEQGLVSKPLLGTLKRFAPSVYYGLGDGSMFTKNGHIKFGKLPGEWTRNTKGSRR